MLKFKHLILSLKSSSMMALDGATNRGTLVLCAVLH